MYLYWVIGSPFATAAGWWRDSVRALTTFRVKVLVVCASGADVGAANAIGVRTGKSGANMDTTKHQAKQARAKRCRFWLTVPFIALFLGFIERYPFYTKFQQGL
jgi:hypothetical protein